jgi:hypothetical protein
LGRNSPAANGSSCSFITIAITAPPPCRDM